MKIKNLYRYIRKLGGDVVSAQKMKKKERNEYIAMLEKKKHECRG